MDLGCALFGAAPFVWLLLVLVIGRATRWTPPPQWTASSGEPPPEEFLYLMFPAKPSTPLYDRPDGERVGVLARALSNSHDEIDDAWIHVNADRDSYVRKNDLAFLPPPGVTHDAAEAMIDAYAGTLGDIFAAASLKTRNLPDGSTEVTFRRMPDDDHVELHVYKVTGGTPTPLSLTRYFGPGVALANLSGPVFGTLLTPIVLGVVGILAKRRLARARP